MHTHTHTHSYTHVHTHMQCILKVQWLEHCAVIAKLLVLMWPIFVFVGYFIKETLLNHIYHVLPVPLLRNSLIHTHSYPHKIVILLFFVFFIIQDTFLLWDEDHICPLAVIASNKRLQYPLQEICSSSAYKKREGLSYLYRTALFFI